MSVLAYCVAGEQTNVFVPEGIDGAHVSREGVAGLAIYFSTHGSAAGSVSGIVNQLRFDSEERIRQGALVFHQVIGAIFRETDIVPFRFPTVLPDVADLKSFVIGNRQVFSDSLVAIRNKVQMEVRISSRPKTNAAKQDVSTGGAAYLYDKAASKGWREAQGKMIRDRAASVILEWKQAEERDGLRCYALVSRSEIASFRTAASGEPSHENLEMRVTGPWPPTRFMPLDRLQQISHGAVDLLYGEIAQS